MQLEKRFSSYWAGRVGYTIGYGRGNTDGGPTAVDNFQVLGDLNMHLNEGPTSADRRHVVQPERPRRGAVDSRPDRQRRREVLERDPVHDSQHQHRRGPERRRFDPVAPGTYSGTGQNAITVENDGRPQRRVRSGIPEHRHAARLPRRNIGQGRTLDIFLEAFNVTNDANFANPTGDMRSASFLVPDSLQGGGFPRQFQLGARLGF